MTRPTWSRTAAATAITSPARSLLELGIPAAGIERIVANLHPPAASGPGRGFRADRATGSRGSFSKAWRFVLPRRRPELSAMRRRVILAIPG